jgi:hypothetical protein
MRYEDGFLIQSRKLSLKSTYKNIYIYFHLNALFHKRKSKEMSVHAIPRCKIVIVLSFMKKLFLA